MMLHFISLMPSRDVCDAQLNFYDPRRDGYRPAGQADTIRTIDRSDGTIEVQLQARGEIITGVVLTAAQRGLLGRDLLGTTNDPA